MIIGIVGFAGSGKGTVGDILVRDYNFVKMSFADSLKDAVSAIFGWDRNLLEGDTEESRIFREAKDEWWSDKLNYHVTPRNILQKMGTEAGRNVFHDQVWIHSLARRVHNHKDVVIPDVRFPNEVNFIRENGGFVIRVVRGKEPKWFEAARQANLQNNTDLMSDYTIHYSEWAWIGQHFNYVISNNGSLIMLDSDVKHMLKVFTGSDIMNEVA
jgi:hypothetical protein